MSQLDRYRIQGELGRGAMGVVYRAHDETLDRPVALKELMLPSGAQRDELLQRFVREARTAASLNHPNIVSIYDVFSEGDRHFIAMEFVEGETLGDMLARGPLTPKAAQLVVGQLLSALSFAHRNGIVHRDIKPDNVFVSSEGHVKVADFGIAKLMFAATASMTQAGTVIGTPGYMAPEQIRGDRVDGRTDLFAAGVLLYELLTGRPPFEADSPTTVMYRVLHEEPLRLPPVAGLPANLEAVIGKAIAKEPALRYQTADEMAADLASGAMPVFSASTAPGVPASRAASSRLPARPLVIAGSVLALAVVATLFVVARPGGGTPASLPASRLDVIVTTPASGKRIEVGSQVDISVKAGGGEVASVAIMWNGTPIKTLTSPPFDFSFTPSTEGDAEIRAVAKDAAGNSYESDPVSVRLVAKSATTPAAAPPPAAAPTVAGAPTAAFWTVIVYSGESQPECEAVASQVRSAGLECEVLRTDAWGGLRPGFFAAYSGVFSSEADAQGRLAAIKARGLAKGSDTYVRYSGEPAGD